MIGRSDGSQMSVTKMPAKQEWEGKLRNLTQQENESLEVPRWPQRSVLSGKSGLFWVKLESHEGGRPEAITVAPLLFLAPRLYDSQSRNAGADRGGRAWPDCKIGSITAEVVAQCHFKLDEPLIAICMRFWPQNTFRLAYRDNWPNAHCSCKVISIGKYSYR